MKMLTWLGLLIGLLAGGAQAQVGPVQYSALPNCPAGALQYTLSTAHIACGSLPSAGVTQIIAGTNVTVSPTGGTGAVTVNASGGGGGNVSITTPTIVQSVFARGSGTTAAVTATLLSTPTTGNVLLAVQMGGVQNSAYTTVYPTGWAVLDNTILDTYEVNSVYWHTITSTDGKSYTFGVSGGTAQYANIALFEISGVGGFTINKGISPICTGSSQTGFGNVKLAPGEIRLYSMTVDGATTAVTVTSPTGFAVDHYFGGDGGGHTAVIGQFPSNFFGQAAATWTGTAALCTDAQIAVLGIWTP